LSAVREGAPEAASLLRLARGAALHRLGAAPAPDVPAAGPLARAGGAVVVLTVAGAPRGSAARVGPAPLASAVAEAAGGAAADPRAGPLSRAELAALELRVAVLSPPRAVSAPSDLQRDDAVLVRSGLRHALLLPERAAGWDFDGAETLRRACVAASLPASAWRAEAQVLAFRVTPLEEERDGGP
jgi:AMMECR1 domain-containing protein